MASKGILIAGTHSGCGKTTITMGIIRALKKRGLDIQPWKAGPDYIDPGFHTMAAGRNCRNLDTMILDEPVIREFYKRQICDLSIVEGVMGLFDSAGPFDERGSAAHLSKILELPVILVLDGAAVARSAAATALGFQKFDQQVNLSGFIINRVGSEGHFSILKESIEATTGLPVLGYLKKDQNITLPERHLGLDQDVSDESLARKMDILVEAIEKTIDLDTLLSMAEKNSTPQTEMSIVFTDESRREPFVRIAVARDEAFRFYYEDNLDMLRHYGAEITFFSPLEDTSIGNDIDAIYLGGGYPELFGEKLASNHSLKKEIQDLAQQGLPVYGECGGYMYMTDAIVDGEGRSYPMLELLPGKAVLGKKLRSLGYCTSRLNRDSIVGQKGDETKGHVFHWSSMEGLEDEEERAFEVVKGDRIIEEGSQKGNVIGSWVHHHFASNPKMARSFIESAYQYKLSTGKPSRD